MPPAALSADPPKARLAAESTPEIFKANSLGFDA